MNIKELNDHLEVIETIIKEARDGLDDNTEFHNKKEQLLTIDRSIAQLERKKIPVPQEIRDLRTALNRDVEKLKNPMDGLEEFYNRLLDLVVSFGKACGKSPRKDLHIRAKEKKSRAIDEDTLSKTLLKVLEEMGGSGHEKEILPNVGKALESTFTAIDLEAFRGKTPRWQTNLRRVRRKLVESGVLTQSSMRRVWTLKK
ncbi:MAG: hypothetical protein H8D55_02605 [Deltaproteobacteria bacterium]|nr:hypothetical protein [Deltaproteobacteria bacterium]